MNQHRFLLIPSCFLVHRVQFFPYSINLLWILLRNSNIASREFFCIKYNLLLILMPVKFNHDRSWFSISSCSFYSVRVVNFNLLFIFILIKTLFHEGKNTLQPGAEKLVALRKIDIKLYIQNTDNIKLN